MILKKGGKKLAFGISRKDLMQWKSKIDEGQIAFLTHYWIDVGCRDLNKLITWGKQYGLKPEWIDYRQQGYSHFDLLGQKQKEILMKEGLTDHIWT